MWLWLHAPQNASVAHKRSEVPGEGRRVAKFSDDVAAVGLGAGELRIHVPCRVQIGEAVSGPGPDLVQARLLGREQQRVVESVESGCPAKVIK